ncbi:MAG: hypothetical protein OEW46_04835 [Actinomycetota bacterium]|nr:hypothetical protein [Actinomycetota bacterium]
MDELGGVLATWWKPLAAVAVLGALLVGAASADGSRRDAIASRLSTAAEGAHSTVGGLLTRELTAGEVAEAIDAGDFRDLYVVLRAEVLTDRSVARVRIWSVDGVILFSTGDRSEIGTAPAGNRPLDEALGGEVVSRDVTEPFSAATAGLEPVPTRMWETWLPLVTSDRTSPQGAVEVDLYRSVVVAGAGAEAERLASTLRVLAIAAFLAAVALAIATARARRMPAAERPKDEIETELELDRDEGHDPQMAIVEVAHERDVSIARASEAEAREQLARERLDALLPLEQRVEIAERRALDAERRLEEIAERVEAASSDPSGNESTGDELEAADTGDEGTPARRASDSADAVGRQAAELRERLRRSAARKKPGAGSDR